MAATRKKAPDPAKMSFEEATAELETIIDQIEAGEIGLEESLQQRRRGEALIRRSREILDVAEQELKTMTADDPNAESSSPGDASIDDAD